MIVTCESCKSRYKLDDSKISGRGAKITCPKCRHVFVVYPEAAEVPPAREPAPPPSPEWEDEEPTRIGMVASGGGRVPTGGGLGASVPPPSPGAKPPPPMLLQSAPPGMNGAAPRANPTLAFPVDEPVRPVFSPPPPPAGLTSMLPGEAAGRAAALDFRKVGVPTWKVKVRIGLVYDFSDIKTLRKYITDGRVTPADVISYDGRTWKPIGEIPDLDLFFVETYELLARQRAEAPLEATTTPPRPTVEAPRAPAPVPDSLGRDPFEEIRKNQRAAAAAQPRRTTATVPVPAAQPPGASRGAYLLVAVLVVVLLAGAWWVYQGQGMAEATATPTRAPAPATPAAPEPDRRKEIQDQLALALEEVDEPPAAATAAAPYELVPVGPRGASPTADGAVPMSATKSAGSQAPERPSGVVTAPSTIQKDTTAADHEAIGDAAARSGDWAGAVRAYENAVALEPTSGRLLKRLGEAQYRSGNVDAAQATLQQAQRRGQKDALKLLAQIARDQGDTSQATYLYQQYLAGDPKDAAEIERILAELSGGI